MKINKERKFQEKSLYKKGNVGKNNLPFSCRLPFVRAVFVCMCVLFEQRRCQQNKNYLYSKILTLV